MTKEKKKLMNAPFGCYTRILTHLTVSESYSTHLDFDIEISHIFCSAIRGHITANVWCQKKEDELSFARMEIMISFY